MGGFEFKSKSQSNNWNETISTVSNLDTLEIVIFLKNSKDDEDNIKKSVIKASIKKYQFGCHY